jgi:hypothetical protein
MSRTENSRPGPIVSAYRYCCTASQIYRSMRHFPSEHPTTVPQSTLPVLHHPRRTVQKPFSTWESRGWPEEGDSAGGDRRPGMRSGIRVPEPSGYESRGVGPDMIESLGTKRDLTELCMSDARERSTPHIHPRHLSVVVHLTWITGLLQMLRYVGPSTVMRRLCESSFARRFDRMRTMTLAHPGWSRR